MMAVAMATLSLTTSAFVAGPAVVHAGGASRCAPSRASARILPAAYTGLGAALLCKSVVAGSKWDASVLFASGSLSVLHFAVLDSRRLATAKRAVSLFQGRVSFANAKNEVVTARALEQLANAKRWRQFVRVKVVGQLAGLAWIAGARGARGICGGAALLMATNVLLSTFGAYKVKHDDEGLPTPMGPLALRMILIIDASVCGAALLGAVASPQSRYHAIGACLYSIGATIGALEGSPEFVSAVKSLAPLRKS